MTWTYYEDFEISETEYLGEYTVSEAEIIEFAERYDPQSFHVDPETAEKSIFNGLVCSGIHTMAINQKLAVDTLFGDAESIGSPGIDKTEFCRPVYAEDTLRGTVEVIDKRVLESKPDRGLLTLEFILRNQHDKVVLRMTAKAMFRRCQAEWAASSARVNNYTWR